ncbi:hypothetical protein MASR1M32_10720 [Rhodobacter sp.]
MQAEGAADAAQEPAPDAAEAVNPYRPFPAAFLLAGDRARRAEWGPGYELMAANAGGRSGAKLTLLVTGFRSGPIEWKPKNMADELLAQDWIVIPVLADGTVLDLTGEDPVEDPAAEDPSEGVTATDPAETPAEA